MNGPIKPIYLFADSQLLFWKNEGKLYMQSIRDRIETANPSAAYIGASNDDNPAYYSIFQAAMQSIGIRNCRQIRANFSDGDEQFLATADLILLAGGDVRKGWHTFVNNGIKQLITKRYYDGVVLIGISAGAVQLGLGCLPSESISPADFEYTFKFIPYLIDVHNEDKDWRHLKHAVRTMGNKIVGFGIPSSGGLVYHADQTLEAIRVPANEFSMNGDKMMYCLVYPPTSDVKECFEMNA